MNRTAPDAPVTTTVAGLSDRHLVQRLKELTAVEHQIEIVVIDHLRELHRRRLYLTLGCSSLFDYATRELGYSEAAAWRRIKAMRLCGEVEGARERMRDGSLTLNSAALLQNAFDRQERKHAGGGRGAQAGVRPAATLGAPAQTGERAEEAQASPVLDSSARQALVEQAAGKSTRQVEKLLAGVDPELTAPADRMRPLGAGRWELKAVIDDDCRRQLEQLKGLLSHVDPHLTLGQLLGRVVREAVERHDPARPPRGRRTGSRTATGGADETSAPKGAARSDAVGAQRNAVPMGDAGETSAPKDMPGPDAAAQRNAALMADADETSAPKDAGRSGAVGAQRNAAPTVGVGKTSAPKERASSPKDADCEHARATAAKRPGATTRPSAPKDAPGPNGAAAAPAQRQAAPAGGSPSPAQASADTEHRGGSAKRPEAAVRSATSAPKAECGRQAALPAPRPGPRATAAAAHQPLVRGRAIPAAVKRQVWERDRGCCSYVDGTSGRRCGSRHLLQIDHILPFALGGGAEPGNLRLLCAAHHRHRHAR